MRSPSPLKRYALAVLVMVWMQAPLVYAGRIDLLPGSVIANNGDLISFDLKISELGNFAPASLGAFDISVGFDPSVLSFASYNLGAFLGNVALLQALDASSGDVGGAVNVSEVSLLSVLGLDTLQPGAFTLATLNFNVIGLAVGGVTQLAVLSGPLLADAFGSALPATVAGPVSVSGPASPVPVPGTLLLTIAPLIGWRLLKRR